MRHYSPAVSEALCAFATVEGPTAVYQPKSGPPTGLIIAALGAVGLGLGFYLYSKPAGATTPQPQKPQPTPAPSPAPAPTVAAPPPRPASSTQFQPGKPSTPQPPPGPVSTFVPKAGQAYGPAGITTSQPAPGPSGPGMQFQSTGPAVSNTQDQVATLADSQAKPAPAEDPGILASISSALENPFG